ncbi:hypothetical protein H4S08_004207 [Coemansia sp. RSA 1365]|nr:hypothetical protein H4S08_004207 [Coemansia sp. RSA 1365]
MCSRKCRCIRLAPLGAFAFRFRSVGSTRHNYTHTGAQQPAGDDADIAKLVADLVKLLGDRSADVSMVWSKYDYLKIKRVLSFIPYESWKSLLKLCQKALLYQCDQQSHKREKSFPSSTHTDGLGSRRPNTTHSYLSPALLKRRALMILGDMWRYSGATQGSGENTSIDGAVPDSHSPGNDIDASMVDSIWKPSAWHYNIVFDVISRDSTSSVHELIQLHRNMRTRGIQEDTITFNTLLNGCRQLQAWDYFRDVEAQMRKRDEWGITHMDTTSWGTLIHGYRQCQDWGAVDKCVAEVSSACRRWYKSQTENSTHKQGLKPTTELWSIVINIYAARDMVPQMIASRRIMQGFGLPMTAHTFAPIFAALHRLRRSMVQGKKDAWPAIRLALEEFEVMRSSNIPPNATILTNLALTVGLSNPYADTNKEVSDVKNDSSDQARASLGYVGSTVTRELESMLTRAHDPNIYAALLNLGGQLRSPDDIHNVWQTLVSEVKFNIARRGKPLLESLTLSSYMNALIDCQQYNEALSAFYNHALPPLAGNEYQRQRGRIETPRLQSVGLPVYEAAIRAFARVDRHRMCVHVMRTMVNQGIMPTMLSVRYALLPPDNGVQSSSTAQYTRRWTLPLATARDIWSIVLESRQSVWARGLYESHTSARLGQAEQRPVIVNDIAAQLIRIAAYARNIEFGEQVFEALNREAAHFGIGHQHQQASEDDAQYNEEDRPESTSRDGRNIPHNPFPEDSQCAPNVRTYTSMITLYCNCADLDSLGRMWVRMLNDRVEPNLQTYTSLITALHKVALRKRWRRLRQHSEEASETLSSEYKAHSSHDNGLWARSPFGGQSSTGFDDTGVPWSPTQQDETIRRIEDWIIGTVPKGNEDTAPPGMGDSQLDLDIPLSTLLLRYHSARIQDAVNSTSNSQNNESARLDPDVIEDIERVMHVCQVVEGKGLKPDRRFHIALADFFDTCGDRVGAELVRKQMYSF